MSLNVDYLGSTLNIESNLSDLFYETFKFSKAFTFKVKMKKSIAFIKMDWK